MNGDAPPKNFLFRLANRWRERWMLVLCWLIFLVPFLISRLPYFLDYPLVIFNPDYAGYYMIADQIGKGLWPQFIIRTPGFPLFLMLVFAFCQRNMAVIVAQNLVSLVTSLFMIGTLEKIGRGKTKWLAPLAAVGLAAFTTSAVHLTGDVTLMSDSLGVNFLLLAFALLIRGIYSGSRWTLGWASLAMAALVLIRPSGMFMVIIFLLVVVFLIIRRRHFSKRAMLFFAVPFSALLFLVSGYNLLTIRSFTVSTFGEHALISYTSMFLEQSPRYSAAVNDVIASCRGLMSEEERRLLNESWDLRQILRVFQKYYDNNRVFIANRFIAAEDADEYALYLKWRPLWKRLALDAIRAHPAIYLKFFLATLREFITLNASDADFYAQLANNFLQLPSLENYFSGFAAPQAGFNRRFNRKNYVQTLTPEFTRSLLKEYSRPLPLANFSVKRFHGQARVRLRPTWRQRLHLGLQRLTTPLFRNLAWNAVFLLVWGWALVRLVQSRFTHRAALLYFLMGLAVLINAVMACMSGLPLLRYSYPLEFVFFLAPGFLLLLIKPDPY